MIKKNKHTTKHKGGRPYGDGSNCQSPSGPNGIAISQAIEQGMNNDHALSLSDRLDADEMERTDQIFH